MDPERTPKLMASDQGLHNLLAENCGDLDLTPLIVESDLGPHSLLAERSTCSKSI